MLEAEDREGLGRIVVARMIAERALKRGFRRRDGAFDDDLCAGRYVERNCPAGRQLWAPPPRIPASASSLTPSGAGMTAARIVAGSAPITTATGMSSPRDAHKR